MNAKTRIGKTLNQQRNCKITVEKVYRKEEADFVNQVLEEERQINNVKEGKKRNKR